MGPHDNVLKQRIKYWLDRKKKIDSLTQYLKWIFFSKKIFLPPQKSKVLIYDSSLKNSIECYLKEWDPETLNIRCESLNIFIFLRSLFRKSGKLFSNYVDEYIEHVKPMLILTLTDNRSDFYNISVRHQKIKTLFIQNALRGTSSFSKEAINKFKNNKKRFKVDYMCVHSEVAGNNYKKFIEGTPIYIGSLKNNHVPKKKCSNKNTIGFISHFRSKYSPGFKSNVFSHTNGIVLKFLVEYAKKNKKNIQIICNTNTNDEKKFFRDHLYSSDFCFINQPNRYGYSSYNAIDKVEVVIGMGSTLTYESAARGNKTAFFTIVSAYDEGTRFRYPEKINDVGPFWTNIPDPKHFKKILDHLYKISSAEWQQELEIYKFSRYIKYDPKNTKIKKILHKELNKI